MVSKTVCFIGLFYRSVTRLVLATEKNKKRIVPSLDVTKSDFTIGFSVVDLV